MSGARFFFSCQCSVLGERRTSVFSIDGRSLACPSFLPVPSILSSSRLSSSIKLEKRVVSCSPAMRWQSFFRALLDASSKF